MDPDIAYANADFIEGGQDYSDRWADDALDWRSLQADIGRARLNIAYGAPARQKFDLFLPSGRPIGLVVFVHGGFWCKFHRSDWSHFGQGVTESGWAVAIPSYSLAPQVRISEITQEISNAITAAATAVRGPVILTGHSAGGQLVARMAMDPSPLDSTVLDRVRLILPISPLGDLRPLLAARKMNAILNLDAPEAAAESPALHVPRAGLPVKIWVGAEERPAFLDQARFLSQAWKAPLRMAPGRHHFDILDGLKDADSPLMRDLLRG